MLGGVAQILINPRPSPRLADMGLFVRPKSQHVDLSYFGVKENTLEVDENEL